MLDKIRAFWKKSGFYVSLATLIVLLGGAGVWGRSRLPAIVPAVSNAQSLAEETAEVKKTENRFEWPLKGEVILPHSPDSAIYSRNLGIFSGHCGIDISADAGTTVHAAANGTVTAVYKSPEYGCTVEMEMQDGLLLRYAGLSNGMETKPGDFVIRGQKIGCIGEYPCAERAYGAHLHFEVIENGISQNPEDFLAK